MRILIAEDDETSRLFLYQLLRSYGDCDQTFDGMEALDAVTIAFEDGAPYDLICLDIMMPKLDGLRVLKTIRQMEKKNGIKGKQRCKIIVTSALNIEATGELDPDCERFAAKPLDTKGLTGLLQAWNVDGSNTLPPS